MRWKLTHHRGTIPRHNCLRLDCGRLVFSFWYCDWYPAVDVIHSRSGMLRHIMVGPFTMRKHNGGRYLTRDKERQYHASV
jgi:hypothetical protein